MANEKTPGDREHGATRAALLAALQGADEGITVRELSVALGLHANSVRFHLSRLVRDGLAHEQTAPPEGPGRPRLVYRPGRPDADGYRLLAETLAGHLARTALDPHRAATEAGEEKGRAMVAPRSGEPPASAEEARAAVTALMRDGGFDPQWDADGRRLWLRHCPFRPTADEQPGVTCSVHLGLMRGALGALGAAVEVTSLEADAAPHPCVALIQVRTPGTPPAHDGADTERLERATRADGRAP